MKAISLFISAVVMGMGFTMGAGIIIGWTILILNWLQNGQQVVKYYL